MSDEQTLCLNPPLADAHDNRENEQYPLTELQQAYWIGEQGAFRLHTPGFFHLCFFTKSLDIARLENALLAAVHTHSAMCVDIFPDGMQRPARPPATIAVKLTDRRHESGLTEEALLNGRRDTLEAELPGINDPLRFACFVDHVDDGFYVHFLFRLFAFDAQSAILLFNDLVPAYLGIHSPQKPAVEFRDFIHDRLRLQQSESYRNSLRYWQERAESLPPAPELPTVDFDKLPQKSSFKRKQIVLTSEQARALQAQARRCGVTLNTLLCTAYTDVLRRWSRNPAFTLNLLISLRPSGKTGFAQVLGNFGNTMLLEVAAPTGGFKQRAQSLQRQMYRDIEHAQVSGVEVARSMRRPMPVVFASSLGLDTTGADVFSPRDLGWKLKRGSLQTPQVWLDCQVFMDGDSLVINWDYADKVLLPGVIEDMSAAFNAHLHGLLEAGFSADEMLIPALPLSSLHARTVANDTDRALPRGLLHDSFAHACQVHGGRSAIIAPDRTLSYDELWCLTTRLAARLRRAGVAPNGLVPIVAERGWRQVSAAMAIVQSGGAYLPVAGDLPDARKAYLLAQQGVRVVLVERDLATNLPAPAGVEVWILEDVLPDGAVGPAEALESVQQPDDLAYVIFTSGSTGQPKGVAIDHRGAVNTVQDVIARFGLTKDDRVIGISAFNFDLSVYDIFATLGTGAALVLPPPSDTPDPAAWARCVREHGVTVWNSVPALLEMQIEYLGAQAARDLASLRLVMLSGDWIPVNLPGRLNAAVPAAMLVGLGGATEASIWSNYFIVRQVDPEWKSIPYGWPLSNQSFQILDHHLAPVPTWVPGDLYIGGIGLAKCYYNDPQRTADSFIYHPVSGERLYRTGDMGRYHADGSIEFLGRNDTQVKIRGFRIELGEIDTTLERCPSVRSAVTLVRQVGATDKQLVAFYVSAESSCDEQSLRQHLAQSLPEYMVPSLFVEIAQLPVTANGKIDRKALTLLAANLTVKERPKVLPTNEYEKRLAGIWCGLLKTDTIGIHDDFFEFGGTSLLAVRLFNAISAEFSKTLPLDSLLRHGTIAAQAALLQDASTDMGVHSNARAPLVPIRQASGPLLALVHPVGGNVLCYRGMVDLLPDDIAMVGLQSPGDGGQRSVPALAKTYIDALLDQALDRPIHLFGWSMGGVIAHEMARQLEAMNKRPVSVTMIDSWMGVAATPETASLSGFALIKNFTKDFVHGADLPEAFASIDGLPDGQQIDAALALLRTMETSAGQLSRDEFAYLMAEHQANYNALLAHRPGAVNAVIHRFRANRATSFPMLEPFREAGLRDDAVVSMDEDHFSIFGGHALRQIIEQILPTLAGRQS